MPERDKTLQRAALKWFQDVAAGIVNLPSASSVAGPTAVDDSPRFTARDRTFTGDELDGL